MGSRKVCILGNYSGRNAGDAAILTGMLREISCQNEDVEFLVPTLNPGFIESTYSEYQVTPISILPWNGCVKLLGLPVWNAIRSSDLVLITDAILFDRKLWNPMQNYLSSLAFWIPIAKKMNKPVALYNVSLGPVDTRLGRWCLKRILDHSDLVILRDDESTNVIDAVGPVSVKVVKGADSALSAPPCDPERISEILRDEGVSNDGPLLGINLNAYGDAFVKNRGSGFSQDRLLSIVSETADWVHQEMNAQVWLIGTQYMDTGVLEDLKSRINIGVNVPLFTNRKYSHTELMGLLSELDLLIGMRTHSMILASSVGTPMVGIVNYPKTYGYLKRIGLAQQAIPIHELELQKLKDLVRTSWNEREAMGQRILDVVDNERNLAWQAADLIAPLLGARDAVTV